TQVGEKKNMLNCPIAAVFKLAKDTGCRTKRQRQRNSFFDENFQYQRSRTREIARKLETVNGEINANTTHIVPPERT
ncbi:hypothetical protein, partial [Vibrio parahaemolyticus]|uniref:hypothetical protein n=1 Tax=Vibrio parahaemolyticus TaxID=670 RepID=UPI000676F44E